MPVLTYTAASSTHIADSSWALVVLWGGGGAGGGATGNPSAGGGGAGGQFVMSLYPTVAGTEYTVYIGQAVSGSTTNAVNGEDSYIVITASSYSTPRYFAPKYFPRYYFGGRIGGTVVAKGGIGASPIITNNGSGTGALGSVANGVGDSIVAGGNGADAVSATSSGGGGGGGGGNASGGTGGIATAPGGNGGDGRTGGGIGIAGSAYGGGGGGAYADNNTDRNGGNGAAGFGIIYSSPPSSLCCLGCG